MLTTVEAEIETNGTVRLLEPIKILRKSRAIVTILDDQSAAVKGNANEVLGYLKNTRLPAHSRPTMEEIAAQIEEARHSWD